MIKYYCKTNLKKRKKSHLRSKNENNLATVFQSCEKVIFPVLLNMIY